MLKILYNAGTKTANVCSSTARVCWGAQPIPRNHRCPGRVLITCALEARSPWRRGGGAEHCCASYALWCCAHTSYCANSKAPVRGLIVGAMMRDMYISARYRGAYSTLALVWH